MSNPLRFLLPMVLFAALLAACTSLVPVRSASGTKAKTAHQPTGMVDLSWHSATEDLAVTIHLNGLTPLNTYPAYIHQGTCQTVGTMRFALKPVVANARGIGTSQTIIGHVTSGIPAKGWSIMVLNGSQAASTDQQFPMVCTAISNVRHRPFVLFDFNPITEKNQRISGQARLSVAHAQRFDPLVRGDIQ